MNGLSADELLKRARETIRRRLFKPPPDDVTDFARGMCHEHLITTAQLYDWLLAQGECYESAYRLIWGPPEHEAYGDDWKAYARKRRRDGKSIPWIAMMVRAIWDKSCESEILRVLSEDYKSRQRAYQAAYRERNRKTIRERDRAYYAANRERILAARKARRKNNSLDAKPDT